jgi:hypothetical protein
MYINLNFALSDFFLQSERQNLSIAAPTSTHENPMRKPYTNGTLPFRKLSPAKIPLLNLFFLAEIEILYYDSIKLNI